jgi:hypothetical protein
MEAIAMLLKPISLAGKTKDGRKLILYQCQCGATKVILVDSVKRGHTRSCGCLLRKWAAEMGSKNITHGEHRNGGKTVEYKTWRNIRSRCTNPNYEHFNRYGGRGITVCVRWQTFVNFLADMGRRPGPEYSLDRINNDGNYEPTNCRWATRKEQNRNTRRNRHVLLNGERVTLAEAAEKTGLGRKLILSRALTDISMMDAPAA